MADDIADEASACIEYNRRLPDGRLKHVQEMSLLRSQLANCHQEIKRLREALLSRAVPEPSELVEVNIKRMETLAASALDKAYEQECLEQMLLAVSLLRRAYALSSPHGGSL